MAPAHRLAVGASSEGQARRPLPTERVTLKICCLNHKTTAKRFSPRTVIRRLGAAADARRGSAGGREIERATGIPEATVRPDEAWTHEHEASLPSIFRPED
jgi:hypothetical protein